MKSEITTLSDPSGSSARIMTNFGFNCFSFSAMTERGPLELLYSQPDFNPEMSPLFSGIPVLYPFGGRLDGDSFRWQGKTFKTVNALTYNGNVLHGFVINRPWRVIEQSESMVVGEFQASIDDPTLLDQWPTDFRIRMSYTLSGNSLFSDINLINPDDRPSPYGFTTHGYYNLDLGGGDPQSSIVSIPAAATWELVDMLPTGRILPVTADQDLRTGLPLAGRTFDTILTEVTPEPDGTFLASIHDPLVNRTLDLVSTGPIREFVFFTPPTGTSVAIEPYTCCPTTFDLEEKGFDAGLRILEPGQAERLTLEIRLTEG